MHNFVDLLDRGVLQRRALDQCVVRVLLFGFRVRMRANYGCVVSSCAERGCGLESASVEIPAFIAACVSHERAWVGIDSHVLNGNAVVEFVHEVV